jgi:hypothetical protein
MAKGLCRKHYRQAHEKRANASTAEREAATEKLAKAKAEAEAVFATELGMPDERPEEDVLVGEVLPDPTEILHRDPRWHYRLFRDEPTRLSVARSLGYIPVRTDDREKLRGALPQERRGYQAFGDAVLHKTPMTRHRARLDAKAKRVGATQQFVDRFKQEMGPQAAHIEGEVRIEGPAGSQVQKA